MPTKKKAQGSKTVVLSSKGKSAAKERALAPAEKAKQTKIQKIDAELKEIAASLNQRDKEIRNTVKSLTKEVAASGKELLDAQKLHAAKGQKGKGFKAWIEANCPFSIMTAYNYIRLSQAAQRRPALLEAKLTDAYIQAGLKKAAHKALPAPASKDEPSDEPEIIDATATAVVVDGDYQVVPFEPMDGCEITMRIQTAKLPEYAKSTAALTKAVKQALDRFFKAFKAQATGKPE